MRFLFAGAFLEVVKNPHHRYVGEVRPGVRVEVGMDFGVAGPFSGHVVEVVGG